VDHFINYRMRKHSVTLGTDSKTAAEVPTGSHIMTSQHQCVCVGSRDLASAKWLSLAANVSERAVDSGR
jgi:hypothetical protein